MRSAWRVFPVLLGCALIVSVGCDSSQPESAPAATATVSVVANADGLLVNCYEVWVDQDFDGNPDVFAATFCEDSADPATRPVPWNYSIDIVVIPKGSTVEQVVTSTTGVLGSSIRPNDGVNDFISMTDYDHIVAAADPKANDPANGIYYLNGKKVSRGNQIYLASLGLDLGTPNILGEPQLFSFTVSSGDTIIVRARKQKLAAAPSFLPVDPNPHLFIQADLRINGGSVSPNGTQTSSDGDAAGMTFSYTVP
jgi:hypothetical protein